MIHNLTVGFFDQRWTVSKAIDMAAVRRLLDELGEDVCGVPTLGGWKVCFEDGCVILPWKGSHTNRVAEEFAIRLQHETGCQIIDREHGKSIDSSDLSGLAGRKAVG
jgi:hypothetical protein